MKSTLQILKEARELLAQPGKWTRYWFARDALHAPVKSLSADACCFCALGAVTRFAGCDWSEQWREAAAALQGCLPDNTSVAIFNDAQETVEPVLALFDRAIAKLEAST
jgi:hypothetical protein